MRLIAVLFLLITCNSFSQEQEPFYGKLVYKIEILDTSLQKMIPDKEMVIYTNDTLLRIENTTDQLGQQVIIKQMELNKSYLLIKTPVGNYAIQADHNAQEENVQEETKPFPYSFRKKLGKRKIAGLKANRLLVKHENFKEEMEFLYLKQTPVKYLNTFENFPGLPVKYYVSSVDGTYVYTLISMEKYVPEKDMFGIPSDFKRVTFNQFMDEVVGSGEQEIVPPKE